MQDLIRTVLVVGSNGFLGGYIVAALRRSGYRVLRGVRSKGRDLDPDERECDLQALSTPEAWSMLRGVDAVVNAAGILREQSGQTFQAIHVDAPMALARACVVYGVSRFVQISALGTAADGPFIATKHAFDTALLKLPLSSIVLRPSVVYSPAGSYGGTSLLRALAGFPGFQWMPGDGRWLLQPISAEHLGKLVARAISHGSAGIYQVGGEHPLSLREYQNMWRHWLRIPGSTVLRVPEGLVSAQVWLWERLGSGPVGQTMWRMLRRGSILHKSEYDRLKREFDFAPSGVFEALQMHPSQTQDRWHAQLYFLAPSLRIAAAALWAISAWAGWATSEQAIGQMVAGSALHAWAVPLARLAAALDALLAVWLLSGWRIRLAIGLMGVSVLAYTLIFGSLLPVLWRDPLGGLAKNLLILPALAALWIMSGRR